MKTKEEIKLMGEKYAITHEDVSDKLGKYLVYACFQDGYTQCQEDMAEKIEIDSPNPKLIDSMAMRYRHDFGFLDKQQQDSIRTTMIQLWEEIVGKGFYSLNKQD